ncbi:hypothetical protein A0H81_00041 [Grifola frondosa]|uniref:Uncharacterized protein n=1 Tax=Grifola frondosa TaxID=5627 RepID=A0A1C7MPH2_GRIFR|nr:hypothetical protein A0H81_00041 [Grifola frondosa]
MGCTGPYKMILDEFSCRLIIANFPTSNTELVTQARSGQCKRLLLKRSLKSPCNCFFRNSTHPHISISGRIEKVAIRAFFPLAGHANCTQTMDPGKLRKTERWKAAMGLTDNNKLPSRYGPLPALGRYCVALLCLASRSRQVD